MDPVYETVVVEGTPVELTVPSDPRFENFPLHFVIRNSRREIGALFVGGQFEHRSLDEMKLKVAFVNGSSRRWMDFQASRERRLGVIRSGFFLLGLGLRYSLQHFGHVMLAANTKRAAKNFDPSTQSI